ncbi:hypothetical protein [Paenibacillus sp. Soil787]|uniref:hypothetical protein n=1 Tax=Paenibacillus sp. Soil787 TaxID=1736411 RepID=UPI000702CA7A|nr:hypothetical protein [Paenibacillus sp. Soil787]KRF22523.1 hypothetical protein ASG93_29850 [Paenibacillus sp. Soil787]
MPRNRVSPEAILEAVDDLIHQCQITGEKLNGALIARRVGCSRATLYQNPKIRARLEEIGVITNTPSITETEEKEPVADRPKKDTGILEKRLQKAEERANRLELLLSESNEKVRFLEAEVERLRLKNHLLSEGRSIL